ncbi:class I SAM-dependent DNA methyltransferase [Campylobacter molothri]|uniref:class I SAM-dependent DNA methyltransferase n=1 Tax=Campylobacter molothri TaxID=1032242 RepID=UPI00301BD777|nr:class I SAM-dependent DNA methyltransferase [Campylobacter sp. RM9930]
MRFKLESLEDFAKKYHIKIPTKDIIEDFKNQIKDFLKQALKQNLEEFQKNEISHFLKKIYGYEINIKDRIDLAIYQEDIANVIFEVKSTTNKKEFPQSSKNLLSKAFYESILYFLRERKNKKNNFIKHIILCNAKEFFIIDAREYERLFYNDKEINKHFKNCDKQEGTSVKTEVFFEKVANYLLDFDQEICYTYFALDENLHDKDLSYIYQILSPQVLLRQKQNYDANALNSNFYKELLYILGLHENDKKNIILSDIPNTLSDAIRQAYKDISFDDIFALLITWNNRILFLRLFESMLLSFEHIKIPFLTASKIPNFIRLSELFFEVLAKKEDQRKSQEFDFIPYMNSSLFDKNTQEMQGKDIRFLDSKPLEIYANSILKKDKDYVNLKHLPLLEYLFAFLRAYDFTTTNKDIQNNQKINHDKLINSSVLGNVFEKLNGYKEGSFYTPSFITSYMCEESITKVVLDKFNAKFDLEAKDISELRKALRKEDKKAQKELLNSIKICDPAVGSGHFLVSALNVMIKIYDQLNLFEHEFYLKLENDEILIQNNFNDYISYKCPMREDDKAHLIQQELFHIKKDIIENCLFGVDINPNSCEITKLRLWIELLKFSYYIFENGKNTHTLQTLPNIDINIKCGNSLIAYFDTQKSLSHYPNIKERMKKYQHIVKDYKEGFYTDKNLIAKEIKNLKESFKNFCLKDKFAKEIKQLTNNANEYSKKYGDFLADEHHDEKFKSFFSKNMFEFSFDEKAARKEFKKLLDLYERIFELEKSHPFEWRFEFPEVLDSNGNFQGFDLIIGNPPYIRQEEIKELKPNLAKNYKVYKGTSDIYTYFYELGFNVLKENGVLSFITSNKYTRAGYGEALREFLLKNTQILEYIDLNGVKVFDSATVDTSILSFKKLKPKDSYFKYLALDNENLKTFNIALNTNFKELPQKSLSKESFTFSDENISALKAKIERIGTPLKDWHGLNIYRGILTGYNEAFIITTEKRNEILANCKDEEEKERTAKLIRKMLRGRDIKRYAYEWAGLWIINTHNGYKDENKNQIPPINIAEYPSLKKHLDEFYPQLEKRADKGITPYNLRNCAYIEEFEKEKIVWAEMTKEPCFLYDNFSFFINQTCYFLTHDNYKYLLAFLNSKIIVYYMQNISSCLGDGAFRWIRQYVEKLPIPKINSKNQKTADELATLVDEILKAKEQDKNADTKIQEDKINTLVYKLYNLTEDEIKIIEGK